MRKILLTGAAGFIGAKTVELLLKSSQNRVIGIDNINDYYDVRLKKHRIHLLKKHKKFIFHKVDIENKARLRELFKKYRFDAVINLAARAGVHYSLLNPDVYFSTNTIGNLNLLELCKDFKVKKYVLASTSSIYAGHKMPFVETMDVSRPISPYAASKKGAEVTAFSYHHLYGIDVSIVRYFTVYGPAGRPDMSVFRFIQWIDQGKKVEIYGDGTQSRDFTYVDDIARGTIKAMKRVGFEVINLGGGRKPNSLKKLIRLIEAELGKNASIVNRPFLKTDMKSTWADIRKAKKLLNWQPQTDLESGIRKTVAWYKENRTWLKNISV